MIESCAQLLIALVMVIINSNSAIAISLIDPITDYRALVITTK